MSRRRVRAAHIAPRVDSSVKPLELRLRQRIDLIAGERDRARAELARLHREWPRKMLDKALHDLAAARIRIGDLQAEVRRERELRVRAEAHRTAAEHERDKAKRANRRKLRVAA